jgi:hypothetical protein
VQAQRVVRVRYWPGSFHHVESSVCICLLADLLFLYMFFLLSCFESSQQARPSHLKPVKPLNPKRQNPRNLAFCVRLKPRKVRPTKRTLKPFDRYTRSCRRSGHVALTWASRLWGVTTTARCCTRWRLRWRWRHGPVRNAGRDDLLRPQGKCSQEFPDFK